MIKQRLSAISTDHGKYGFLWGSPADLRYCETRRDWMHARANYMDSSTRVIVFMSIEFFGKGFASITWSLVSALAPERLSGLTGGMFNFIGNLSLIATPLVIGLNRPGPEVLFDRFGHFQRERVFLAFWFAR